MSYDTTKLSLVVQAIERGGAALYSLTTVDPIGTVLGAGYVSDATKKGLRVGDLVLVSFGTLNTALTASPSSADVGAASDFASVPQNALLQVNSISSGAATLSASAANMVGPSYTASTGTTLGYGNNIISSTAAQAYALPAPFAGAMLSITKTSSSTAVQTASSTLGGAADTIGLSGVTLTFSASDQSVILEGISSSKWQIVSNVGSVAVS